MSMIMAAEQKFRDSPEDEALLSETSNDDFHPRTPRASMSKLHTMALYLTITVQALWMMWTHYSRPHDPSIAIYSPAAEAVEYHVVDFGKYFLRRSEYMPKFGQLPTDDLDKRWEDLYDFGISSIPRWQADKLENKTEAIPGTEDYLIELDMFHQLHCLDMVRKALYPDRYEGWKWNPDGTVNIKDTNFHHWEHCIDGLRQAIQCTGDISPLRHRINGINGILAPDLAARHTCRNFTKIKEWAKERQAPEYEWKVALGLADVKPDFTLQEAIDTEV
ncbi:hypothetical protein TI39_contig5958g00001 [Zymoseptoria brevis]|uniref:Uncharacterized protein n=1 Tax=Zymoseptoria brevis TaxID=1047168 RepID=A0A0F4G3U7_9PEZI|nr:hypothetical protein TI39_contig5958g00001 [Zymoseptoria brevis]